MIYLDWKGLMFFPKAHHFGYPGIDRSFRWKALQQNKFWTSQRHWLTFSNEDLRVFRIVAWWGYEKGEFVTVTPKSINQCQFTWQHFWNKFVKTDIDDDKCIQMSWSSFVAYVVLSWHNHGYCWRSSGFSRLVPLSIDMLAKETEGKKKRHQPFFKATVVGFKGKVDGN